MGVQGFVSFLENHPQIYRDVRFMKSRLLIDGANLIHLLYFDSNLDQNHGGEYAAFEELIEKFIAALRACEITPYVLLDGGSDHTDKKLETTTKRAEDRIQKAHRAAESGEKAHILPQLANLVFKQTLARLNVPMAKCYAEADQEIASLAREWQCPVLSNDSDFYIFDLPGGLLPISKFQWEGLMKRGSQSYIPCKGYNISSFCTLFDIQRQLLPTFAALAGNDYVKLQRMDSSISWGQYAPAGSRTSFRLEGLTCWLRNFKQPQEALEGALELMGGLTIKKKLKVQQSLAQGMEEYELPPSTLKRFFIHGTAPPFLAPEEVACLVPDWTRLRLTRGLLTTDILDVLLLQRRSLSFPVEHGNMPSASLTSRPIRQVIYGLLLGKGTTLHVEERDREGLNLKYNSVQPTFKGLAKQLKLESLDKVDPSQRLQVLLESLRVTQASLSRLPTHLHLPVAATCYWFQRATPTPDMGLLKALVLNMGGALKQRTAVQNQHTDFELNVDVVHAFNQWQACLKDSIHLNQLLDLPLPEPRMAQLYEGTMVHQLVRTMRSGKKLRNFLKSDRDSVKLYQNILSVIHEINAQSAASATSQKAQSSPRQRQPLGNLPTNLQQLFIVCDDEQDECERFSADKAEEDLQFDDELSVRTRYKAKERNNRCNKPELSRKQELRGLNFL
ncbi:protein asteroid homolog 1-like [Scomber scombrus]|uniref:protein asteroid homolog 1-like n=1 Tax=Scomber scombrus TaxID=13677 RepID=UPI002DDABC90|nr:protein asteroid homolog 1-like [Scomber scombrus]